MVSVSPRSGGLKGQRQDKPRRPACLACAAISAGVALVLGICTVNTASLSKRSPPGLSAAPEYLSDHHPPAYASSAGLRKDTHKARPPPEPLKQKPLVAKPSMPQSESPVVIPIEPVFAAPLPGSATKPQRRPGDAAIMRDEPDEEPDRAPSVWTSSPNIKDAHPAMSPEQQQPRASSSIVRDLNCRIAFVAAITTPLDGSLSARTKEFTESMFTSALSKHYSACAVVLTNRAGSFDFLRPRLRSFQEVVYERFWGGEDTYMYDRTRSYVRFLAEEAQAKEPRDLVFTDTDILFIKSLNEVFDLPFDVGLTYRLMPKYPINNGIMFAHHSRLVEASRFWAKIVDIYDKEGYSKKWQGDQYAVCKFMEAAGKYFNGRRHYTKKVSGVEVRLLHISSFNFPPRGGCKIGNMVKVLHFKGDEKTKLPQAWKILQRVKGPRAINDIAWLNAPPTLRARGNLKNCRDS